jgi:hypothetical protein
MHPQFSQLTNQWFMRAFNYTGSIGNFRYRYLMEKDHSVIHTAVYTRLCYEAATDVVERDFPWDDEGVEQLKAWMQLALETYEKSGALPKYEATKEDA